MMKDEVPRPLIDLSALSFTSNNNFNDTFGSSIGDGHAKVPGVKPLPTSGPPISDWLHKRPYLSLDFLRSENANQEIGPLGKGKLTFNEQKFMNHIATTPFSRNLFC